MTILGCSSFGVVPSGSGGIVGVMLLVVGVFSASELLVSVGGVRADKNVVFVLSATLLGCLETSSDAICAALSRSMLMLTCFPLTRIVKNLSFLSITW